MTFDDNKIQSIAKLAMLSVDESDLNETVATMDGILALIDQMQGVDTQGVVPLAHPQDPLLRLREDVVTQTNQRDALQALTTHTEQGLYKVPKVIE